jgi:hypothetical protein
MQLHHHCEVLIDVARHGHVLHASLTLAIDCFMSFEPELSCMRALGVLSAALGRGAICAKLAPLRTSAATRMMVLAFISGSLW